MASKKAPSAATQLKNLKIEHSALTQLQERTVKERDEAKSSYERQMKATNELSAELEQCHTLLDALPGAIGKTQENGYTPNKLMTRLAAWFAVGQRAAAKQEW